MLPHFLSRQFAREFPSFDLLVYVLVQSKAICVLGPYLACLDKLERLDKISLSRQADVSNSSFPIQRSHLIDFPSIAAKAFFTSDSDS